jgi:anthranilate phosphoribosyltransferase
MEVSYVRRSVVLNCLISNSNKCDIVGTGGDSHNTFNISTTASVMASSLLLIAKHGNRASTSKSGSADLLQSTKPKAPVLDNIDPSTLAAVYSQTNYAFLFAPVFHPGMRYVAPIRKELGWRTIFNLLGPLSNPVDSGLSSNTLISTHEQDSLLEARVIGVARRDLGPSFAEALRLSRARKAMVVCGDEELDELSCAGPSHCWWLAKHQPNDKEPSVNYFQLQPSDFGFPTHPLTDVRPGREPAENAETFLRILEGDLAKDDPLMHFVLINTAALFVVSGICEANTSNMGPGDDGEVIAERGPGGGRWKEGVRRARWAIKSGAARGEWERFTAATHAVKHSV